MAVQFQSKRAIAAPADGQDGAARDAQERLTMERRIEAFYRQSGGPNNPEIPKILEKHLLYGRDHGPKGKRETLEDALRDMIAKDYSNQILFKWFMQARMERQKKAQAEQAEMARIRAELEALKQEVRSLRALMEAHVAHGRAEAPGEPEVESRWS
ncbi:hypothetical protein [Alicyclobacillus vulcanalis]|uniref:Uncharacterized protein n=1 Tax=Alicyclobacillus vulcanalis TaxID=252246 RepID=A0A1N7MHU9_9BACL|nr:hypothetical protein [Alicyclobacillus vulcanalis]SIS85489.1 hypothetical protein SAMN05421799_105151 [Alicyclobacillus vulcanalis]